MEVVLLVRRDAWFVMPMEDVSNVKRAIIWSMGIV
jgi:hypothetical protein